MFVLAQATPRGRSALSFLSLVFFCLGGKKGKENHKEHGFFSPTQPPKVGPATTQNLVVKFDGEIRGGVLVENVSDNFPQQKKLENLLPNFTGSSPPISPKTSPTSLWKLLVLKKFLEKKGKTLKQKRNPSQGKFTRNSKKKTREGDP